jgi:hypothetical protein
MEKGGYFHEPPYTEEEDMLYGAVSIQDGATSFAGLPSEPESTAAEPKIAAVMGAVVGAVRRQCCAYTIKRSCTSTRCDAQFVAMRTAANIALGSELY